MFRFLTSCCIAAACAAVLTGVAHAVPQDNAAPDPSVQVEKGVNLSRLLSESPPAEPGEPISGLQPVALLLGYSVLIVLASMLGGWLPAKIQLTHTRMQTVISLVGGLMLGIGVFHLMPHAVNHIAAHATARWMMVGIVMMFVLMRLFHFHNHEPVSNPDEADHVACDHGHSHVDSTGEHHSAAECHTHGHSHGISWMGIAFGLSVHTLIDGLALGASVYSDAQTATGFWLFGFGTFVAIAFHKPLDAVSITSLMVANGWSRRSRNLVNIGFAMMCPIGAVLFLLGVSQLAGYQREIVGTALAFAAGVFICISLSDLLPEMEFHSHNRVQLTAALGLGIVIAWMMALLHPAHL